MTIAVLLADDHGVLRDGMRRLLESNTDISVVAAAQDGLEAVQQAALLHPDVVVMDIAMPQLNGIEATRLIVGQSPATGVVILSMHFSSELIRQAFSGGARGYLLKESAASEVVTAVRAVAAGGQYLGRGITIQGIDARYDGAHAASVLRYLTQTELDILKLVVNGKSNAEAALLLRLSPRTVETYRSRLMEKLQLDDLPALVKFAVRYGLTTLD